MKKVIFFFALAAGLGAASGLLSSCGRVTVTRDGDPIEDTTAIVGNAKKYTFRDFKEIEMDGYAKIYLTQDSTYSVVAKGSTEALRSLKIGMEQGKLIIERTGSFSIFDDDDEEVSVYISMPVLASIEASGVGNIQSQTVFKQTTPLDIDISGACNVDMHIEVPKCTIASSGAGAAKLIGTAPVVTIDISGAGDINTIDCIADSVTVEASGAGEAKVYAAKHLDVDVSGAGNVRYKGNPVLVKEVSGAADVTQIN